MPLFRRFAVSFANVMADAMERNSGAPLTAVEVEAVRALASFRPALRRKQRAAW